MHQLRLACPRDAVLVTGVKRDIDLLKRVPCESGVEVTVLDISLDTNVQSLRRILAGGGRVTYVDHHSAKHAFSHPRLQLWWDDAPDVCTSILVDRLLQGRFRKWAIVAAFGDNLAAPAQALAGMAGLHAREIDALEMLGRLINYNAYGELVEDLCVAPDELYRAIHPFHDPLDFIFSSMHYPILADGYHSDLERMENLHPCLTSALGELYILPPTPWARRISGVLANSLAARGDGRSFAVLTERTDGSYVVSVRSGRPALLAADAFCERFESGGGRKSSAGINVLPASDLDYFIRAFLEYFAGDSNASSGERHAGHA
ncbi:MAG TPA: hypothetical protein VEC35_12825 [Noviherbaspirillum sp.]|nr:hypothetical protein [Noviherbaspirillum sp.]